VPIRGREKFAQLLRTNDGFIAVMVALSISALIGVAGLATEVGMWYALKRENQTATDAAALSAAFEYAG
jgi:Flp pilus assembly protein TadG